MCYAVKGAKMMILMVLIVFCSLCKVDSINLTYYVENNDNIVHSSCIAEELERYVAIGWIYPIPDNLQQLPNIDSKFLPPYENDFNCKFSKNSVCNTRWSLKNWKIDDNSPRTRTPLFDNRWEDLKTVLISNNTKEFMDNFELENTRRISFSVRAQGTIELFFCSGWNPYNYPCLYFNMNNREIYFKVYQTLPKNISGEYKTNSLQVYRTFSDIVSQSEWRSFVVSFETDGVIKLIDVILNRTLIEQAVKEEITPIYMFMRSENPSLWKFHENSFLQTTTAQISRLGPQLTVTSKDLCISLLVNICNNCEMYFFHMNGTVKKILKFIGPMQNEEWLEIKLKEENIELDKVNLFVETKFVNMSNVTAGFWAIDNVRICNENEVKVNYLKLKNGVESEGDISCQVVKKPNWRPKKHIYNKIHDFPQVKTLSGTNFLKLSWAQEDPLNQISYFISYKANDICNSEPYNEKRLKSNGFISTKMNEVVLDNLVPFTLYNVTIFTVLHENEKKILLNTLESDELNPEELPHKIQLRPLDTAIRISWEPVRCSQRFGRVVHSLIVSNKELNFTTNFSLQTDTNYEIGGLEPFTQYTLTILTARNGRNIHQKRYTNKFAFNFTTSSGIAPPVQNLELYSIDKNSASLRFQLPMNPHGIVREVQVSKCNVLSFSKCKATVYPLRECPFWPGQYCVNIQYLIPYQTYSFRVSLKNINTHTYGKEMSVDGFTNDRVPGVPTNVTYRIVECHNSTEYCHLNITWRHPYNQNGTITAFHIVLNSTDEHNDFEDSKNIQEVYTVNNSTYYSYYTYQIKYLPYSTNYDLYLQSENLVYKSSLTHISLRTDEIGDHIDQSPKLLSKSDCSLMFQLPVLDRRLHHYEATVVVQDYNMKVKVDSVLLKNSKIVGHLCHQYGNSWVSNTYKVDSNKTVNVVIGDAEKETLLPGEKYCIIFIITNNYKGTDHDVVYYEKLRMLETTPVSKESSDKSQFNPLYLLLLILLLIPIGFVIYRYTRKNKRSSNKTVEANENIYESLPFEECESTSVNNENYDKLIHK